MPPLFVMFPIAVQAQTTDGEASISIKVPGTFGACTDPSKQVAEPFNGYQDPFPTGRYLDRCEIWADEYTPGDLVTGLHVSDLDGVVPEPMRPYFPAYPVIGVFYDVEITETENVKAGLFTQPNRPLSVSSIDKIPMFVPSGLYIAGTFKTASTTPKTVRCNFFWGKKT